jgi:hypothetical protein
MDNSAASATTEPIQTQATQGTQAAPQAAQTTTSAGWKAGLRPDISGSPLMAKFDDTVDGLNKAFESHANLEKLLGHEKVPIPKDDNDVEGWNRFSKAMGIPDKAEQYGLADPQIPQGYEGLNFDKNKFTEIVHAHKLTPSQAKGLWEAFTKNAMDAYGKSLESNKENMVKTVNTLKGKWGDAYQANVEQGQMVINKFSKDQDTNDFITNALSPDPRGIEFLATIGEQFAENKVGEFAAKRFSLVPEQAKEEWHKIVRDPEHAYNNPKASSRERQAAIDYVNSLIASANRGS